MEAYLNLIDVRTSKLEHNERFKLKVLDVVMNMLVGHDS